jgi:hypothetical protein
MHTPISTLDLNEIAEQINSEHEKLTAQVKRTAEQQFPVKIL